MTYKKVQAGEWVQPIRKGYRLACCDCGLVHKINFRLRKYGNGTKLQFRAYRHNRATAQLRLHRSYDFQKVKNDN